MQVNPYLIIEGRCEEALEFYKKAVGAEVKFLHRFKEAPEPPPPGAVAPGWENKIMHATFTIGDSTLHASDGNGKGTAKHEGFSLSLTIATPAEADRCFTALADQGQVKMPLSKTFFSPRFGMLTDRFGVAWMVYVAP
jgi:PhnB protein